jgi:hypothetical protein
MTESSASLRARLVDLSVVATSALVLAGAMLVVVQVDTSLPRLSSAGPHTDVAPGPIRLAPAAVPTVATAPSAALVPAPRARQRVLVVRRSRAS